MNPTSRDGSLSGKVNCSNLNTNGKLYQTTGPNQSLKPVDQTKQIHHSLVKEKHKIGGLVTGTHIHALNDILPQFHPEKSKRENYSSQMFNQKNARNTDMTRFGSRKTYYGSSQKMLNIYCNNVLSQKAFN